METTNVHRRGKDIADSICQLAACLDHLITPKRSDYSFLLFQDIYFDQLQPDSKSEYYYLSMLYNTNGTSSP